MKARDSAYILLLLCSVFSHAKDLSGIVVPRKSPTIVVYGVSKSHECGVIGERTRNYFKFIALQISVRLDN